MLLSLPGEADVAAYSYRGLSDEIKLAGAQRQYQFADGEPAALSDLHYGGLAYVSNPLTDAERTLLAAQIAKRIETNRVAAKQIHGSDGHPYDFKNTRLNGDSRAWGVAQHRSVFKQLEDRVFFWHAGGGRSSQAENQRISENIVAGLSLRAQNLVPATPGVCLPGAFIRDAGDVWRSVGMTFRLKLHPDVTVWLEDANALRDSVEVLAPKGKLEYQANEFWTQYENTVAGEKIESIWKSPATQAVTLGGQSGLSTFVRIHRPDRTVDVGYMAIARGDATARQDTPRLRLYVIRDAERARKKGIEPVSEAALLEMAEAIARSIKHR